MTLRLNHARRKNYVTEEKELKNGIPYLVWKKYPKNKKLDPENSLGVRVWIAGESPSSTWTVKEHRKPGTVGFKDGGFVLIDKFSNLTYVEYDEVIIHPSHKDKKQYGIYKLFNDRINLAGSF